MFWRTPDGHRLEDGDEVLPATPPSDPSHDSGVLIAVLSAFVIDSQLVVERGPIVGWVARGGDDEPLPADLAWAGMLIPVTVMMGHKCAGCPEAAAYEERERAAEREAA
jgi:hypothetical protein